MKHVIFLGDSLERIREFPSEAQRRTGVELRRVQFGEEPYDWKPMKSIGPGVREIRVRDEAGAFRTIYLASKAGAIYVLHAFQKKTQATSAKDIELAKRRLREI